MPLKKRVSNAVNHKVQYFSGKLLDMTGLEFEYESLSPSLLSNFLVKGISVSDTDGNALLEINKAKISYNIFKLLKKDIQGGITSVVIDGISLDVYQGLEILNLYKGETKNQNLNLTKIRSLIPDNVKLKNISLKYDDGKYYGLLDVKSIGINNKIKKSDLDVKLNAVAKLGIYESKKEISTNLDLSGTLEEELDNSRMNVKLSNVTDGNVKLNKLSLLAVYTNKKLEVHTIQAVNPIQIAADYHFESNDLNLQVNTENLKPLSIVTITSKQKALQKYKDFKITTDTIVNYNLKGKSLYYISDSSAYIPEAIVDGGLDLEISVYGNEAESTITNLKVDGEKCNIAGNLNYVYENCQLSGLVEIPSFVLNNGTVVSTEVYIDSLEKGFMAFTPQIFIGDKALTALQFSLIPQQDYFDFTFEMSDYSHLEESDPGVITVDGSILKKTNYIQSNITLTNLYLDSLAVFSQQLVNDSQKNVLEKLQNGLNNYVFSGDVYVSTDLKSVSYNIPYILIANSKKDNQVFMFSLNGTEQNLQLNEMTVLFGNYAMEVSGSLDKSPDSSDLFFTLDLNTGSIPYHFAGTFMDNVYNITGDYGTDLELRINKNNSFAGHVILNNLPFVLSGTPGILSTNTDFSYKKEDGPSIQINRFEVEGANSNTSVNPRFGFSGNATQYGAQLNSVVYSDLYSSMQGNADIMLNVNDSILDSIGLMTELKNPLTQENIKVDFTVSNPDHLPVTVENLKNAYYLNLQILMKDFGLNRFASQKNENNHISGSLNAFGTIEHPYVALNIEDFNYLISTDFLRGNGNILLEDREVTVDGLNIYYNNFDITNIAASASLLNMNLKASGDLSSQINKKTVYAPLELSLGNAIIPEGKFLPDAFTASISTTGFSGSFIKKQFPLTLSAIYSDNTVSIYSSENAGINGTFITDGILQLSVDNKQFLKFNLDGLLNMNSCNLDMYDFEADLGTIASYVNFDDLISIQKGKMEGEVIIGGKLTDPDFTGAAVITKGEVVLPWLTKQNLKVGDMNFLFNQNEIGIQETTITSKKGERVNINFNFVLNKWALDHIEGNVKSVGKDLFPIKMEMPVASLTGDVMVDLALYMDSNQVEVKGSCFGENTKLVSSVSLVTSQQNQSDTKNAEVTPVLLNLDITLGTHASVDFDPLLRCVFVPDTKFNLKFDQENELVSIDGEVKLRSGDIVYLNRNFYIKSGSIDFTRSAVENPLITINAETREKDSKGQNVRIIMDIDKQHLLDFEPRFSSVPAKSENEIRIMLGQIALADSSNAANLLFAASDYAIQSTVVRQAENKLRDLCNFDIFSLRTNVLQNTLNMGVSGELSKKNLSIGNFLDNTTVYIGKYLGSSLYLDAMMNVTFENAQDINDIITPGKVLFHPQIGMELEAPFANIRVNMAPDINALLNNRFVPSTSLTLSWKVTF